MRIEEIIIESFGRAGGLAVNDLTPGLNVLVGRNEAGKTTVLEFVRAVFFGFKRKSSPSNIYESGRGAPRKGRLTLYVPHQGRVRMERAEKRGAREGVLTVFDDQGSLLDPSVLPIFRAGLDRGLYESLFAFDLDAMSRVDQDALRGKITAAALGSMRTNPVDVRNHLWERIKRLSRRTAADGESLPEIQSRLRLLDKRLRAISNRPDLHSRLKQDLDATVARRTQLASEAAAAESELARLDETLRFEYDCKRLALLQEELVELNEFQQFPPDGLSRFEQALERLRQDQESLQEVESSLENLCREERRLDPDPAFAACSEAIHSLNRAAHNLARVPEEIERLRNSIAMSLQSLQQEHTAFGVGWSRDRILRSNPSFAVEQEIRCFIDSWKTCKEVINSSESRISEASERCRRLQAAVEARRAEIDELRLSCRGFLDPESLQRLQEWKSHYSRVLDLEERLVEKRSRLEGLIAGLGESRAEMERLSQGSTKVMPTVFSWLSAALGLTAGVGMIYAGRYGNDVPAYGFLVVGTAIVLALPLLVRWKVLLDRNAASQNAAQRERLNARATRLTGEIAVVENERRNVIRNRDRLRQELDAISREVLGTGRAGLSAILGAERQAAAAQEPMRKFRLVEASLNSALTDLGVEERRLAELRAVSMQQGQEFAQLKSTWEQVLAEHDLEPGLEPEPSLVLIHRLRELKAKVLRIAEDERRLDGIVEEWSAFCDKIAGVADDIGLPVSPELSPLDQVQQWSRRELDAKAALSKKETLQKVIHEHETRAGVLKKRITDARDRINALMESARAADEDAFRLRASGRERFTALQKERRDLATRLVSAMGFANDASLYATVASMDWQELRASKQSIEANLRSRQEEREHLADLRGRLEQEISALEADEETDRILAEREELLSRLNRLAEEWITLNLATRLLDRTILVYETERQPAVLERGSEIFRAITGGGFKRILFPLDHDGVKAERCDGGIVGEELLSRGTLEQLYLALRLAHIEVYHRQDPIPVLMDDILVNYDPERAGRTAEVLVDFSRDTSTQVLFFTCHSAMAELFPPGVNKLVLDLSLRRTKPVPRRHEIFTQVRGD